MTRVRFPRFTLELLEDRLAPAGLIAAGAGEGRSPEVRFFDAQTGDQRARLMAYPANFTGGVRVAAGDVNGDFVPDLITAPGAGIASTIKVFDGNTLELLARFDPFGRDYRGGANVAVGDFNGDGVNEIVAGADTGPGRVRTFSIIDRTPVQLPGALGNLIAFGVGFRGGVRVAAGDIDGQPGDELIVGAGPGSNPTVKVFSEDGQLVRSVQAYGRGFTGGVWVGAGDVDGDGNDDIITGPGAGRGPTVKVFDGNDNSVLATFDAFARSFRGGVPVAAEDINNDGRADLVATAGLGVLARVAVFDGQTLQRLTSLTPFPGATGGGFGAVVQLRAPDYSQAEPEAPVLSRLARYAPVGGVPSVADWTTVGTADTNLDPAANGGKTNIYVIVHGWAPGFQDMVQMNGTPTDPLKWWETLDTSLPGSPGAPASAEMFYGAEGADIIISPNGLASAILQADPKAIVLAYSWIDDSATSNLVGSLPAGAYLSEAYTSMNGYRLATALQAALPGTFNADGGKLHVIGHSHGSKVATVATGLLDRTNNANFEVAHLTILDSPEDGSFLVRQVDAANNLWYFLGGIDIGRNPGETFVDNYISELDEPLGVIQGFDPLNTSQQIDKLQEIVDVSLAGDVLYSNLDPFAIGDLHGYSFSWYGAAGETWAQNPTPTLAAQWSPLIDPAIPPTLAGSYTQTWTKPDQNQFQLAAGPQANLVSDTPKFTDLSYLNTTVTAGSSFDANTGTVVLTESGTSPAMFTGKFGAIDDIAGISFNFDFTNVGAGDQLVISVDTGLLFGYQTYFVMPATVAGTGTGFATLSLSSLADSVFNHTVRVQLIPAAGSTGASVTITNVQQFTS